ncbi:DNA polymerase IV [Pseudocolwellia sp. HL-MZ19]|uniref:DNA polymerase IV n=1 Tax=unclassified Pseudocolwellia TaxID=2848178 RepID=UPI003CF3082A
MVKKFIHIDMDAFFVSVEIRDNPTLANKPVAVGGKSDRRGVLSTCNYIAREYGVGSAMATSIALQKCPDLIVVPGRMDVYKQISVKIRAIFEKYTHLIEPLSLDEAFLDVTECTLFKGSATLIADQIRQEIFDELNLTASAGIAPNKFLAKIASDENKPNGQCVITPDQVGAFVEKMSLSKIPGVGKVTFEKLKAHGLEYGRDVIAHDKSELIHKFGKLGISLWDKCQGIDNREVVTSRVRKSVGVERTFAQDFHSSEEMNNYMVDNLIPELKKRSASYLKTRTISKLGVKVKFNDFQQTTKEFKYHSFDEQVFNELLHEALARGEGKSVRLLGVHIGLSDEPDEHHQFELGL